MTSYSTSIDTFSPSRTVFEIFDFKVFRVWPWPLTFRGHLKSKIFPLFESPYMTSYLTSIDTFYLVPFSRYSTSKFWSFWLWPLTFRGSPEVKNISTIRKLIYDFLFNFYWHFLSLTVFDIFDFKVFRYDLDLWPLGGHLKSKIFPLFESPYMTSYLTSIDTFSLSRTVFEILTSKFFRVWPWPLTFGGHQRSKIFSLIESTYMIPCLTSIDTFSLSRTVFEIFDFVLLRIIS